MQLPRHASIAKEATVGTAAYVRSSMNGRGALRFLVYGTTVTVRTFAALAACAGSIASDIKHATLFSYLPLSQKYDQLEATVTSSVVSTGIFFGTAMTIDARFPREYGVVTMADITLLANAIGDYAYSTVLAPMSE